MKRKEAYILRGITTTGKSTFAREITKDSGVIHSTDDFFKRRDGSYVFEGHKLRYFHKKNLEAFKKSIDQGVSPVVCDNTNHQRKDLLPYKEYALTHEYLVFEVTFPHSAVDASVGRADRNNGAGIPQKTVEKTIRQFEL